MRGRIELSGKQTVDRKLYHYGKHRTPCGNESVGIGALIVIYEDEKLLAAVLVDKNVDYENVLKDTLLNKRVIAQDEQFLFEHSCFSAYGCGCTYAVRLDVKEGTDDNDQS